MQLVPNTVTRPPLSGHSKEETKLIEDALQKLSPEFQTNTVGHFVRDAMGGMFAGR